MRKIDLPVSSEIVYLQGNLNYTQFYLRNGKTMVSSYTLLRYEQQFSEFMRINKQYLVNAQHIAKIEQTGKQLWIRLETGERLRVSRRRKVSIKKDYSDFLLTSD